jgi:hypothetical protein
MSREVNKFNTLLDEFLEKLIVQFDNNKLRTYRKAFLLIKGSQPRVSVNLFMASCENYKSQITSRDDKFFLNDKKISEVSKQFGNFTDDIGLTDYWNKLTNKTKTSIWDYIQSLFVLGEIIINKDKDMFNKYKQLYISDYKNEINNLHGDNFSVEFIEKLNS